MLWVHALRRGNYQGARLVLKLQPKCWPRPRSNTDFHWFSARASNNHNSKGQTNYYDVPSPPRRTQQRVIDIDVIPSEWGWRSRRIVLVHRQFLESGTFQALLNIFQKCNFLQFCRIRKEWYIELSDLKDIFGDAKKSTKGPVIDGPVSKLRKELRKKHINLGAFPCIDSESEIAHAVENFAYDVDDTTVVILRNENDFLICCHPERGGNGKKIHDIVGNLTGVTEYVSDVKIPTGLSQHVQTVDAYRTYDIWLVAEFEATLSESFPELSIVCCDRAAQSLASREGDKISRQRPIAELKGLLSPEFQLHPHQNEGIRFFLENDGRGLLSFEMGLGKTATVLAYMALKNIRAIVVCPKPVRSDWPKEAVNVSQQYFQDRTLELGGGCPKMSEDDINLQLGQARLVCVNYESLTTYLPQILTSPLTNCIIIDESHLIKNPRAKRTKILLNCKDRFQHRILLSGTPIKNDVVEMESQLEFIGHDKMGDFTMMTAGAFQNKLYEKKVYLNATMRETLPHLPFKVPVVVEVDPDYEDRLMLEESVSGEDMFAQIHHRLLQAALYKVQKTSSTALQRLKSNPGNKVLIFSERVACVKEIAQLLEEQEPGITLVHLGEIEDTVRKQTIDEFRRPDSSKKILVSTRQSLSSGINLQCANVVIFNDLAWSPADIRQAAGRVKRLSQEKNVEEYWMTTDTLFDTNLISKLQTKMSLVQMYTEGKNISKEQEDWMNKPVSMYEIAGIEKPAKNTKKKKKGRRS